MDMNVYDLGSYMVDEGLENLTHIVKKGGDLVGLKNDKFPTRVGLISL